jgi:threonine dehydratase
MIDEQVEHLHSDTKQARQLDYLRRILLASIYDLAIETDLTHCSKLSAKLNNQIYLKREDQQPVHSFKLRGAYNKLNT